MEAFNEIEKYFLYPYYKIDLPAVLDNCDNVIRNVVEDVAVGRYTEALQRDEAQLFLGVNEEVDVSESLSDYFKNIFLNHLELSPVNHNLILCIGISCLQLFVQNNFCGPVLGQNSLIVIPNLVSDEIIKVAIKELCVDSEGIYDQVVTPEFLFIAKCIFIDIKDKIMHCISVNWWCMRFVYIHQKMSCERSPSLYNVLIKSLSTIEDVLSNMNDSGMHDLLSLYHIEASAVNLHFCDVGKSDIHINCAKKALGVNIYCSGALGKRTMWQERSLSQLVVKVEYTANQILSEEASENFCLLSTDLPKDLILDDDTRLNHIKFDDTDEDVIPNLRPIEQALLLSVILHKRKSRSQEEILSEESKAFLSAVLQFPKNWSIQSTALLLRSQIESCESRSMQRSLNQLEELVSSVRHFEPSRFERLKLLYSSMLLPYWELQQQLGKLLMCLGCIRSALEIFEKLHLWEDVITCYNELGFRNRSAEIIKSLLNREETPHLWCLMGDATDDIDCYTKAWELSNYRSGRSQRCLGNYYYVRKEYKSAIFHYEKSLEINYLQFEVWLRLGYAALQLEEWEKCASAYMKCSILEPDTFECWNNMSQAYLRLGQKERAWKALQEALRCRNDSWKLWDNYMLVSTSLGYISQALYAYSQILNLKSKHVDTEVLGRIVSSILLEGEDPDGRPVKDLYKQCLDLVSTLTREVPTHPELWALYGELLASDLHPNPCLEIKHQAMQCFRKSLGTASQRPGWEKDALAVVGILYKAKRLIESSKLATEGVPPKTAIADLNSVKMSVRSAILLARKGQHNIVTDTVVDSVKGPLLDVENNLHTLVSNIETLNETL